MPKSRVAVVIGVALGALLFCAIAQAQDQVVGKDEFINKLGGDTPTAPSVIRFRGPGGVKTVDGPPVAKQVSVSIRFKYDSTALADEFSRRQLREAGQALASPELRGFSYEIGGHTDGVGSEEYNMALSQRRAQAVKDALCRGYKVDCAKLGVKGYGKTEPVASNDDEEGRAQNRRVVFKRIE
jgi:outer membrane protein OmpA-like peptidoglycan-associated protein